MAINKVDNIKSKLIDALVHYKGIVSTACESVGLSRTTFYNYVNEDAEFARQVEEAQETAIDFVEGKLFEKINGITMVGKGDTEEEPTYTLPPSDTAIIFYLKTKGRKRGYAEKVENTNISYTVEVSKEEAQKIAKDLEDKF